MYKMYRINYVVSATGASCTIYTYPILEEKNSYYIIRSGKNKRHIKKNDIGEIKNVDMNRTGYYVFLTQLEDKNRYIEKMINVIKENAILKVKKFQSIYDNAIRYNEEIVDVEPE